RLSADAGISFGGHGGSLFVVIANVVNTRLLANGVVEVHGTTAGDEEDVADSPIRELADDVVGKLHARRTFMSHPWSFAATSESAPLTQSRLSSPERNPTLPA